jgi:Fe-S cluster biogenesis protein NfuA
MADMAEQVKDFLVTIRPMLQADGGDVELVNVEEDGTVKLRLKGACGGCPMSRITLKRGIEARMKQVIPAVKTVEAV